MGIMDIFAWPLGWVMWFFYNFLGNNYVLSLILFTIVIRAVLIPSAIKQQKTTGKMSAFQPKIQALQKKYGNNKKKFQEEQMKLYEEEGYNPMGGCLPALIQIPVIYGLFNVVYNPLTHLLRLANQGSVISSAIDKIQQGIGGSSPQIWLMKILNNPSIAIPLKDKATATTSDIISAVNSIPANVKDQIKGIDLNFFGLYLGDIPTWSSILIIIPILSGISALLVSLLTSKLTARNNPVQQAGMGMMKGMMYLMPLMSFFIAFSVPAGVGLYWTISNIIAGIQSFVLYKIYTPEKMAEIVAKEKELIRTGKKKPQKKSLMSRMQEAQIAQNETKPTETVEETATQKEINRKRIAEARKRMAEKYGESYNESDDN